MITADEIRARILAKLPDAEIRLVDQTGDGDHWEALVVSGAFTDKSLVEQHQLVYAALREEMKGPIHALALKTRAP